MDPTDAGPSPSRIVGAEEARLKLNEALARLPEAYARVIALYDLKRLPVQDVAKALDRSTGAVYMLRRRALDMLHEMLGPTSAFLTRKA